MALQLEHPQRVIDEIVSFLADTYRTHGKTNAVIAVSGGIDSALSLSLLATALSPTNVYPVFLPCGDQSTVDSEAIAEFTRIPKENWINLNIKPAVDAVLQTLNLTVEDHLRSGNVMARTRMILLFDVARQHEALVCGTENKSEKYLGYFTRFGDEASDIEPIQNLYKTQVRQLAQHLGFPTQIITKAPSAGLWQNQTDETELGFTYEVADQVLEQLIDEQKPDDEIAIPGVDPAVIQAVMNRVDTQAFKHHVPYILEQHD